MLKGPNIIVTDAVMREEPTFRPTGQQQKSVGSAFLSFYNQPPAALGDALDETDRPIHRVSRAIDLIVDRVASMQFAVAYLKAARVLAEKQAKEWTAFFEKCEQRLKNDLEASESKTSAEELIEDVRTLEREGLGIVAKMSALLNEVPPPSMKSDLRKSFMEFLLLVNERIVALGGKAS